MHIFIFILKRKEEKFHCKNYTINYTIKKRQITVRMMYINKLYTGPYRNSYDKSISTCYL